MADEDADPDPPVGHGRELVFTLTADGGRWLREFGIAAPPTAAQARPLRYCLDWSEQRPHLAGWLGRALLGRVLELGWVRRAERGRALYVTATGRVGLDATLGIASI